MSSNQDPAPSDALDVIRSLDRENVALKLIKPFKGLVLKQDVSILDVDLTSAIIQATNLKMCAILEGLIYLHSRALLKPVAARVMDLNVNRGIIILSDFAYLDTQWTEREHERVCQKLPTYVSLRWKKKSIRAPLENISVNGMGILAYKMIERGMEIEPGSKVCLDFQLPSGYRWTALRGMIVYLRSISSSLIRLGIRLYPNTREALSLQKWIARRKQEIMEELNQAYMEARKPRGVECQFF